MHAPCWRHGLPRARPWNGGPRSRVHCCTPRADFHTGSAPQGGNMPDRLLAGAHHAVRPRCLTRLCPLVVLLQCAHPLLQESAARRHAALSASWRLRRTLTAPTMPGPAMGAPAMGMRVYMYPYVPRCQVCILVSCTLWSPAAAASPRASTTATKNSCGKSCGCQAYSWHAGLITDDVFSLQAPSPRYCKFSPSAHQRICQLLGAVVRCAPWCSPGVRCSSPWGTGKSVTRKTSLGCAGGGILRT